MLTGKDISTRDGVCPPGYTSCTCRREVSYYFRIYAVRSPHTILIVSVINVLRTFETGFIDRVAVLEDMTNE